MIEPNILALIFRILLSIVEKGKVGSSKKGARLLYIRGMKPSLDIVFL